MKLLRETTTTKSLWQKVISRHFTGPQLDCLQPVQYKAVSEAVSSAKVQSDLITNVSHDLKTPLTSIINYSDLMDKEEDPQTLKKYAGVIHEKSIHLKDLIENLFEVSQTSKELRESDLQDLDLKDLTSQVLGEWEDDFKTKGLDLVYKDQGPLPVCINGNRGQRILDNLRS